MTTIYLLMLALLLLAVGGIAYMKKSRTNPYIATGFALMITIVFASIFLMKMNIMEAEKLVKQEIIEKLEDTKEMKEEKVYEVEIKNNVYEVELRKNAKGEFEIKELLEIKK